MDNGPLQSGSESEDGGSNDARAHYVDVGYMISLLIPSSTSDEN